MRTDDRYKRLIEEVDFLLARRRQLRTEGPHFIVVHSGHESGAIGCLPGETIEQISLGHRSLEFPFRLTLMPLLVLDCLCRYRRTMLTAARIEEIMHTDPFYVRYGTRQRRQPKDIGRPNRASVKVYVQRIREHMEKIFGDADLRIDPRNVLIADSTDSNTVAYRLKASVEFVHWL